MLTNEQSQLIWQVCAIVKSEGAKHWREYALALEVFNECCADGDVTGAIHARKAVEREREILRYLGEYE